MLLKNKIIVVYGAAGAIGSAVARAFALEGARVFLTGHRKAPVETLAREITAAGGSAEAAEVDALDEQAIDDHLTSVVDRAGRVDVSFNAIGISDTSILGVPLLQLNQQTFFLPIESYVKSYFLTARLAARLMIANKAGVIMTVTAPPARSGAPLLGGYVPAQAAKEALTRSLSVELAPEGIRVISLRPQAIAETDTIKDVFKLKGAGVSWEQWQTLMASRTHTRRLTTLDEVSNVAAFMASDRARGMTGTVVNLTMGTLDD
jgi:NAD(P)-dependent dehydrogenase (short-subunit alcohol dehydrogenase family)